MANTVSDVVRLSCSEGDGAETSARTGVRISARMRDDADRSEEMEGKIDITILDKTNKTPILVSY